MADVQTGLRKPWILGDKSLTQVSQDICGILERKPTAMWWTAFLISLSVLAVGAAATIYQVATGIGSPFLISVG